ncbi:MAG: AAA family ATPase [Candidatus Dormibacteraceae bacterium]
MITQADLSKPNEMFDREYEWSRLVDFITDPRAGAQLGIISGRRRQGKSFLLRALCQAARGFYFAAEEAADGESLRLVGMALADHINAPAPLQFNDWHEVLDALLALGRDRCIPIVIDEFPYLVKANPSLPSIIQQAFGPLRPERDTSRARVLLCGSALSFMGRLLSGNAPLRGRVGLELVVPTLDYRLAAEFWGIGDPSTALKVNAIVGGTPAYRREYARDDTPSSPADFDAWVVRTVLSPASPLFREARYLLADESELHDTGLYHSVLAAIAEGNATRGGIASYLGRKSGDLAHPLTVLEDCGLLSSEPDVFREKRTTFHIAEPLLSFYHAVMRPIWSDLEHTRDATLLWQRSQRRYTSNIVGPHFEHVCRYWTRHLAPPELFGDYPTQVGVGVVNDPLNKTSYQLDVAVSGLDDHDRTYLLAVGEVKWNETMGMDHLERLRRIRALLVTQGWPGAGTAKLACYSGAGFTLALTELAEHSPEIVLVGLDVLYA